MNTCKACGKTKALITIGGVLLCNACESEIRLEIDRLRAAGKPVNVGHIAHRIYKETHAIGNYLLRDVPAELFANVKHRIADTGQSIRDFILEALHEKLARKPK